MSLITTGYLQDIPNKKEIKEAKDYIINAIQDEKPKTRIAESLGKIAGIAFTQITGKLGDTKIDITSNISSCCISIGLALLGGYIVDKNRTGKLNRFLGKLFGTDVSKKDVSYVLNEIQKPEYYSKIQNAILNFSNTKDLTDFANAIGITPAETWEVYQQIKDIIMDESVTRSFARLFDEAKENKKLVEKSLIQTKEQFNAIYQKITTDTEDIINEIIQSYGLILLPKDYFTNHKSTEKDIQDWKKDALLVYHLLKKGWNSEEILLLMN